MPLSELFIIPVLVEGLIMYGKAQDIYLSMGGNSQSYIYAEEKR